MGELIPAPDERRDAPRGLFLSRDGAWYHDGERVRHPRLAALLHRSIARRDGGLVVTTGRDVLPFTAEDAPFFVRTLSADALVLSDDSREPLAPRDFLIDDDGRVRCRVKSDAFWALLSRSATQILLAQLDADGRLPTPAGACSLTPTAPRDWGS
jgi:hypothetical protein